MRVVITGAGGQLGRSLQEAFADRELLPLSHADLEVSDPSVVGGLIALKPELVLHAAAMTDVDGCERDPRRAHEVNGLGTRWVAEACRATGAIMVYFSTDYVFDGHRQEPYAEEDPPHPINVYGRTKLEGELEARSILDPDRLYIVRTAWLYGPGANNFVEKVLRLAAQRESISMVTTEVGSPTYTEDLSRAVRRLVEQTQYGIYHLTNQGACSRYEWAAHILQLAGMVDYPLHPIERYERPAAAPPQVVLANTRAAALGIRLRPWRQSLADYMAHRDG